MTSYIEALELARKLDKTFTVTDFKNYVIIRDKSPACNMHLIYSGLVLRYHEYLLVFGEHIRPLVFCEEDIIVDILKFSKKKIKNAEEILEG